MDYNKIADEESISNTIEGLKSHNFDSFLVETGAEALQKIASLIPTGASVMSGASETLREIGYVDYLKDGSHKWRNLHGEILAETDQAKQSELRRSAALSDYFVGSVHAITETGEMLIASNGGNQLAHLAYTSPNIILVVGVNKVVKNLTEAFERLEKRVIPLESERLMGVYGVPTTHAKTLILHKENPVYGRKILVILVREALGF